MNSIDNLIGAARIAVDIEEGNPHVETQPSGLLDPATTDASPVIINLFNQCRKDKALVKDSDEIVTLHEIGAGESEATRNYWKHSEAFHQTLNTLENLLTPLPNTPLKIRAITADLTQILKDSDRCNKGISKSLMDMKAEVDLMAAEAQGGAQ